MKKYIKVKENIGRITDLKVEVYYSLGGMNYFTYKTESRGYYLSVTPVQRSRGERYVSESYTAFTGIKQCIKTVSRKSKKAEQEAEVLAEALQDKLIKIVCDNNNLVMQEDLICGDM